MIIQPGNNDLESQARSLSRIKTATDDIFKKHRPWLLSGFQLPFRNFISLKEETPSFYYAGKRSPYFFFFFISS
jgi:hypothetical protein